MYSPLLALLGFVAYLLWATALPQIVYLDSIRNMYYDCLYVTGDPYVYKAHPGACTLNNLEYRTTLTHDQEGFRNPDTKAHVDVALIGDSHTHGFGVNDQETFAALLRDQYHYQAKSLAMASYATMRELEALKQYTNGEKVVVIQYCDNDFGENIQSLRFHQQEFLARVTVRWMLAAQLYAQQKQQGWRMALGDFARRVVKGDYPSKRAFVKMRLGRRNIGKEAEAFAAVLGRYRELLSDKTVVVFESSSYGFNHPGFKTAFEHAVHKHLPQQSLVVMDTATGLQRDDYYWLDDHLNARGHAHLASLLNSAIEPLVTHTSHPPSS